MGHYCNLCDGVNTSHPPGPPPSRVAQALRARAGDEGSELVVVSAKVESELNEMPPEEAAEWLDMLGVTDGGLESLVRATYKTLGLQTYFTTGGCCGC